MAPTWSIAGSGLVLTALLSLVILCSVSIPSQLFSSWSNLSQVFVAKQPAKGNRHFSRNKQTSDNGGDDYNYHYANIDQMSRGWNEPIQNRGSITDKSRNISKQENLSPKSSTPFHSTFWNVPFIRNFSTLLDVAANRCGSNQATTDDVAMVIGVVSAPNQFDDRQSARQASWYKKAGTLTIFLLGSTNDSSVQQAIKKEHRQNGDIFQQNFEDSFWNLTYKVLAGMEWILARCPRASWFLRLNIAHYDVNLTVIEDYTRRARENGTNIRKKILCPPYAIYTDIAPFRRDSKYITSVEEYPEAVFPPFCEGTSYILPVSAMDEYLRWSRTTRFMWLEDVYITGILRERIGNVEFEPLSYPFVYF